MRNKRQSLEMLEQRGFSPDLIVDIGVASGTDGLYDVWPEARYVLVEPLAKFKPDLDRICSSLLHCEQIIALASDVPGESEIATFPHHPAAHVPAAEAPADWERALVPITTVDAITASRVALNADTRIVLKIDVDGPELKVLAGSARTLTTDCVVIIEGALLDNTVSRFGRIIQFLLDRGFEVFDIVEPLLRPGDDFLWQVDLVFVRRDSRFRSSIDYYGSVPKT